MVDQIAEVGSAPLPSGFTSRRTTMRPALSSWLHLGDMVEQRRLAELPAAVDQAAVGGPRHDLVDLGLAAEEHLRRDLPGVGGVGLDPAVGQPALEDRPGAGVAAGGGIGDERLVDQQRRDAVGPEPFGILAPTGEVGDPGEQHDRRRAAVERSLDAFRQHVRPDQQQIVARGGFRAEDRRQEPAVGDDLRRDPAPSRPGRRRHVRTERPGPDRSRSARGSSWPACRCRGSRRSPPLRTR